jgi:hypothetical protein
MGKSITVRLASTLDPGRFDYVGASSEFSTGCVVMFRQWTCGSPYEICSGRPSHGTVSLERAGILPARARSSCMHSYEVRGRASDDACLGTTK